MDLSQSEIMESAAEDPDDHWDHENTTSMLSLYLQNIDKFRNPHIRKKNVWMEIANGVGNKTPDSCDKKFRNLKQTYIRLLRKKKTNGVTAFKWPYFDAFEEIYNIDGEYQPEIRQKVKEGTADRITRELLEMTTTSKQVESDENEPTTFQNDEIRRKMLKKRHSEFKKVALEMRDRQRVVEEKLDRLINIVEESNSIQRERNRLFQQFLGNFGPS